MNSILKPSSSLYFSIGANIALILSIGLNVALVASWAYPTLQNTGPATVAANEESPQQKEHPSASSLTIATAVPLAQPHFDWQQLESDDYPTYISNLRSAGIPESTVRSIVSSEVAGEYEFKKQKITTQRASTAAARIQKQQLLEQLSQEQAAVVTSLLDNSSQTGKQIPMGHQVLAAAFAQKAVTPDSLQAPGIQKDGQASVKPTDTQRAASLPAVMVPANPAISLNELQTAEWENLQAAFAQSVSHSSQDPTDPAYLAKWNEEQKQNDELFRSKYGTRAYVLQSLQAGHTDR